MREGRKMSEENKRKLIAANIGRPVSAETRLKMRRAKLGRKLSAEHRGKIGAAHKGSKRSAETRKRMSEAQRGEKGSNWRGGKTKELLRIRNSAAYKIWRSAVYARDNFSCVECGDSTGGNLEADHKFPFAHYPELRLDVSNGRTLCIPCHKNTDTYGQNNNIFLEYPQDVCQVFLLE